MTANAPKGFWAAKAWNGFAEILRRTHSGSEIFIIQKQGKLRVVTGGIEEHSVPLGPAGERSLTSR